MPTTTTSSGTACATTRATALPDAGRRGRGRHPGHAPLPDLPRRRHRRQGRASTACDAGGQQLVADDRAAAGVSCYEDGLPPPSRATSGQATLPADLRRRTTSGTASSSPTAPTPTTTATTRPPSTAASARRPTTPVDQQLGADAVTSPASRRPAWAKDAVIYQIFPDRFRNGRTDNDPKTGDVRYDDPVLKLGWGVLPEGYCRNYADGDDELPVALRHDAARRQPDQGAAARPRLLRRRPQGRRPAARLPRRRSASTRSTSTRSSTPARTTRTTRRTTRRSIPYFGTQKDWENLVKHADARGHPDHPRRRVQPPVVGQPVLRPLPPLRDGRAPASRLTSPYRSWFVFTEVGQGSGTVRRHRRRRTRRRYEGWFGFDSHPGPATSRSAAVQAYFLTAPTRSPSAGSQAGASGWRLDVSGDAVVPGRLLGDVPRGRQGDRSRAP